MTKIGINGFGRIGRKVARLALERNDVEIAGINDLTDVQTLAHLFKYDSVHGTLNADIHAEGDSIFINGKKIKCYAEPDPTKIPWDAQVIYECTGRFTLRNDAAKHLKNAKRVIISAPSKDPDATLCMGVNHHDYDPAKHEVISNASCTTNCLAPLVKVLDDHWGVRRGTMTTVHAYTADQRLQDAPHKDLRRARAAANSQIPTTTGAAKAVGLVLPHLKGKLDGFAIRVPTANVSLVDFVGELKKETTKEDINKAYKKAATESMKGILGAEEKPLVSIDYNGNTRSSTIDLALTTVIEGNLVKVVSWYDNESGFSARMLDLTAHMAQKGI